MCMTSLYFDAHGLELGLLSSPCAEEVQRLVWVRDTHMAAVTWEKVTSLVLVGTLIPLLVGRELLALVLLYTTSHFVPSNCFLQLFCILPPVQKFRGSADLNLQIWVWVF